MSDSLGCIEFRGEFYEMVEKDEVVYLVPHDEFPEIPEDLWEHDLPTLDMRDGERVTENMDPELEKIVREALQV